MRRQPVTPLIYDVVEQTTPQMTVVDVVLGAVAVVGTIVVVAVVLGIGLAGLLVVVRRSRGESLAGGGSQGVTLGLGTLLRPVAPSGEPSARRDGSPDAAGRTSPPGRP